MSLKNQRPSPDNNNYHNVSVFIGGRSISDGQPVDSDKLRGFLTNLPDKKVLLSFSKCPLFLLRVVGMLKDNQFFPGGRDDPEPIKVYPKHVAACIWEFRNKLRDRYNEPVRFQEGDEGLRTYADRWVRFV